MTTKWWVPLSGIAFVALVAAGLFLGGDTPTAAHVSAKALTKYWIDHGHRNEHAALLMALGLVLFVYFGSVLKNTLDSAPGATGCASRAAFAGVVVFVVGGAVDLSLVMSISANAGKIDPVALQALGAYWDQDWVPFAIGVMLLTSGAAISAIRHGGIPKWLGWLAAVVAIIGVIPNFGFFAMPGAGIWIILTSIVMAVQARKAAPAGPPAM